MRTWLVAIGLVGVSATSALAYDGFSPLSGPNTAIPSPVCDIINFGFCPQPPSRALDVPDPNAVAPRQAVTLPPPPSSAARHTTHRRHDARRVDQPAQ